MPGKKEAEDGASPQEAGHFALDLCHHESGHAGAPWTPICPQKFSVRPQRFIFSQPILESAPQPKHRHEAWSSHYKHHPNAMPNVHISTPFAHRLKRKKY